MRKLLTTTIALLLVAAGLFAQNYRVFEDLKAVPEKTSSYDWVQDFSHGPLTPSPEGYTPFYIGMYARHGARYAWDDIYVRIDSVLTVADAAGLLTDYGRDFKARLETIIPPTRNIIGKLTRKGWEQHRIIADNLMDDFPEVFDAGAHVRAISSPVYRCVMSMASCCLEIARRHPELDVYEDMNWNTIPEVNPTNRRNPFPVPYGRVEAPFDHTHKNLDLSVLAARLISDPGAILNENYGVYRFVDDIYTMSSGIASTDFEVSFEDFWASPDEKMLFWLQQNSSSFNHAYQTQYRYYSVAKSLVDRADACIASGVPGVDLRFGHDNVLQRVLMQLNVGGFGHVADSVEEQVFWYQNYKICMGAHLVTVLYRGPEGSPILLKVLLNDEETTLPDLTPVDGPYYRWDDFRSFVLDTVGARAAATIN